MSETAPSKTLTSSAATQNAAGGQMGITINVEEVMATIGAIPLCLTQVLQQHIFGMMDHHRKSVLKHNSFPSGRRAQKLLAMGLHRYGRKTTDPTKITDLVGESFAAAEGDTMFARGFFKNVEYGARISAKGFMAIPIQDGVQKFGNAERPTRLFIKLLEEKGFDITKKGILTYSPDKGPARRKLIMGVLRRERTQKPLLNFFAQWARIRPKHEAIMERDVELALTAAGQIKLERKVGANTAGSEAWKSTYDAMTLSGATKGKARAAAKKAAAEAKRNAMALANQ